MFISLTNCPYDLSNTTNCTDTLRALFCVDSMALNPDKSETFILGTSQWAPATQI